MNYFFTSDEHYGHRNIIKYCARPFLTVEEMDASLIKNHNEIVKTDDIVVHVGDFTLKNNAEIYTSQLNGHHIYLKGSHDRWLPNNNPTQWEKEINGIYIVANHYAMRVWPRSHYGSWLLYGHSHGNLEPFSNQWDVGVDNNNFYPVSFEQLKKII